MKNHPAVRCDSRMPDNPTNPNLEETPMNGSTKTPCYPWMLSTLASSTVAVAMILLAVAFRFPQVSNLLIALLAALWVSGILVWAARHLRPVKEDEFADVLLLMAFLFAFSTGSVLFVVALVQIPTH